MKKIGIIGAMDEETRLLREKMTEIKSSDLLNTVFYEGRLGNVSAVLVRSGIGKVNAALCAQLLVREFGVTHIINTGIAGGLDSRLHMFDFVVSTDAVQHDVDATGFGYEPTVIPRMETSVFAADPELIAAAQKASGDKGSIFTGRVASGDQFIADEEKKAHIKRICAQPLCVEMEGAAIAQTCHLYSTPFVIIRCISDMADSKTEEFNEEKAGDLSANFTLRLLGNLEY